jgi:hypothetical protein
VTHKTKAALRSGRQKSFMKLTDHMVGRLVDRCWMVPMRIGNA